MRLLPQTISSDLDNRSICELIAPVVLLIHTCLVGDALVSAAYAVLLLVIVISPKAATSWSLWLAALGSLVYAALYLEQSTDLIMLSGYSFTALLIASTTTKESGQNAVLHWSGMALLLLLLASSFIWYLSSDVIRSGDVMTFMMVTGKSFSTLIPFVETLSFDTEQWQGVTDELIGGNGMAIHMLENAPEILSAQLQAGENIHQFGIAITWLMIALQGIGALSLLLWALTRKSVYGSLTHIAFIAYIVISYGFSSAALSASMLCVLGLCIAQTNHQRYRLVYIVLIALFIVSAAHAQTETSALDTDLF